MTDPGPRPESPVFAYAKGLTPRIATAASPWTMALGLVAVVAIAAIVFFSLQANRLAKIRAAEKAYEAANPPYRPPPPPPLIVVPPNMAGPDVVAPPALPPAPPAPVVMPTPVLPGKAAESDLGARYKLPAMIVDLSGSRAPAAPVAMAAAPSGAPAAAPRPDSDPARMSAEERFAERVAASQTELSRARRMTNPSRTVAQGAVIPAVLETSINSDLPGFVRAVVARDVRGYDSDQVLIPRGSKLIGQYRSGVATGQSRAFIVWTRVLTPEGVSVEIASPGADRLGRGGLEGETDTHFFQRFGASILLSVLTAGLDLAVAERGGNNTAIVIGSPAQAANVAQLALQKQIDIPPTIKVPQGQPIRVFVARDLDFSGVAAVTAARRGQ